MRGGANGRNRASDRWRRISRGCGQRGDSCRLVRRRARAARHTQGQPAVSSRTQGQASLQLAEAVSHTVAVGKLRATAASISFTTSREVDSKLTTGLRASKVNKVNQLTADWARSTTCRQSSSAIHTKGGCATRVLSVKMGALSKPGRVDISRTEVEGVAAQTRAANMRHRGRRSMRLRG